MQMLAMPILKKKKSLKILINMLINQKAVPFHNVYVYQITKMYTLNILPFCMFIIPQ